MSKLTLYHFTSLTHYADIQIGGISKGDVATSPTGGFNAPCFTTNKIKSQQGWASGSCVDKLQVRITVEIESDDPRLKKWNDVMKEHKASKRWKKAMASSETVDSWYVFMGVIPPEDFKEVQIDEKRKGTHPVFILRDGIIRVDHKELE